MCPDRNSISVNFVPVLSCYDLKVCVPSPQNSYEGILTPPAPDPLQRWWLSEVGPWESSEGHEGGALTGGMSALVEKTAPSPNVPCEEDTRSL